MVVAAHFLRIYPLTELAYDKQSEDLVHVMRGLQSLMSQLGMLEV